MENEKVKIGKNNQNGVDYDFAMLNDKIEATICLGNNRTVLRGNLTLENMQKSWKFGKQLQIVIFGKDLKIEERANNNGWNRIEIAIPFYLGKELFDKFNSEILIKEQKKVETLPIEQTREVQQ